MPFVEGPIEGVVIRKFQRHSDKRGWLAELFRSDELAQGFHPSMAYVSATLPKVVRGPHEHVEQTDYFCFLGPGRFKVTLWDNREGSPSYLRRMELILGEDNPASVLVPKGVVHCYRCVSSEPGWVFNAPDRLYMGEGRRSPVDEIRHEDDPENVFVQDELARRMDV